MAAVTPITGNRCKGTFADGTPDTKFYCKKEIDDNGDPVYTCATWRKFRVNCPKVNAQCNSLSEAYLPAITVCAQRLY